VKTRGGVGADEAAGVGDGRLGLTAQRARVAFCAVAVGPFGATVRFFREVGRGGAWFVPAWLAVTSTVPAPVIVRVLPATVAGPLLRIALTGRPGAGSGGE
jgi:hypothetical protein